MKPLRWFGYKVDDDKVWSTINDALKPFGIFVEDAELRLTDNSYRNINSYGETTWFRKNLNRSCMLNIETTYEGYLLLTKLMKNQGAKSLHLNEISGGFSCTKYRLTMETWNDFDSIENFLRMNNDHHQQSPH